MMKAGLIIVLAAGFAFSQVAEYLSEGPTGSECARTLVVAPMISQEDLGGEFEPDELTNASNMLANTVAKKYKETIVVSTGNLKKLENCNSSVIAVRLKSYHKEPARMGQFRGFITIDVLYFDSPQSAKPSEIKTFEASGKVHWGDSTPFANAVESVCRKIRYGL